MRGIKHLELEIGRNKGKKGGSSEPYLGLLVLKTHPASLVCFPDMGTFSALVL